MFSRIQWRIAISFVALIALILTLLGIALVQILQRQQLAHLEVELLRQARLVADAARETTNVGGTAGLDALAKRLGRDAGARITLIAADGTVVGDSEADPRTMDNHRNRPEVRQALESGSGQSTRYSATIERDLLYVAVPIDRDGTVTGVARVALPITDIRSDANQVAIAVFTAFALAATLSVLVAFVVARRTAEPITALTRSARRLAAGDLDQTILISGRDEVSDLAQAFNEMALRIRRHVATIEEEHGRLSAVVAHFSDGLVIVDAAGTVRLVNPAAARLLGISSSRSIGQSVIAVVHDYELKALVGAALAGERDVNRVISLPLPGVPRTVRAQASRLPDAYGGIGQALLVLHDITEERRVELLRRDFVANVSHELRTPVAALRALAETLADGALEDPEAARDFLDRMLVEADGLTQLVQDLLDLSRIESGQVPIRPQSIDLAETVTTTAERLRPLAERGGVHLIIPSPPDLPPVQADPERIGQVVTNLVHNAVKFTPPGGTVTIELTGHENTIAVAVRDTGIGIPAEALPRIFERFFKADRARSGGGTGLGLAISKHLIQLHGGTIRAESAGEGRGATLTFTLPIR